MLTDATELRRRREYLVDADVDLLDWKGQQGPTIARRPVAETSLSDAPRSSPAGRLQICRRTSASSRSDSRVSAMSWPSCEIALRAPNDNMAGLSGLPGLLHSLNSRATSCTQLISGVSVRH